MATMTPAPANGRNYYRIKQTDFDGSSSHSSTVEVWVENQPTLGFLCYPNPTQGEFKVRFEAVGSEEVKGRIFDLNGQMVQEFQYAAQSGIQEFTVDMANLPDGVYMVRLFTSQSIETVKLVKTM